MNTLPKLVCLALLLIFAGGCEQECRPAVLGQVDVARSCVLPASEVPGLQFCHRAGAQRTKGLTSICVLDRDGNQYVGTIATDEHISGSGFYVSNNCSVTASIGGDGGCPP